MPLLLQPCLGKNIGPILMSPMHEQESYSCNDGVVVCPGTMGGYGVGFGNCLSRGVPPAYERWSGRVGRRKLGITAPFACFVFFVENLGCYRTKFILRSLITPSTGIGNLIAEMQNAISGF